MSGFLKQIRFSSILKSYTKVALRFTRMNSNYLINDPKYSFLKDLGLDEKNYGVFSKHGRWFGDGDVI